MKFEIAPKETEVRLTWDDAKLYCFSLNIDGKTGWRLPTAKELNDIYDSENDFEEWYHWSSTVFSDNQVWCQNFSNNRQDHWLKSNPLPHVRAIRDI